jgi:DNA gyrase subunit A
VNVLQLAGGERVQATLPVRRFDENASSGYVLLCTRKGVIKKTTLEAYSNPRRGGIIAINLAEDDEVIGAGRTAAGNEVIIATRLGKSIRFAEHQARAMGRTAVGVRGIALGPEDEVVGMEILSPGATILTVTQNGYGKRTPLEHYRLQNRGGQGIITIRVSERNGPVLGIAQVVDDDEVMLITDSGRVLRCRVKGISTMGRATQGVRVMDLSPGENLASIARVAETDDAAVEGS